MGCEAASLSEVLPAGRKSSLQARRGYARTVPSVPLTRNRVQVHSIRPVHVLRAESSAEEVLEHVLTAVISREPVRVLGSASSRSRRHSDNHSRRYHCRQKESGMGLLLIMVVLAGVLLGPLYYGAYNPDIRSYRRGCGYDYPHSVWIKKHSNWNESCSLGAAPGEHVFLECRCGTSLCLSAEESQEVKSKKTFESPSHGKFKIIQ